MEKGKQNQEEREEEKANKSSVPFSALRKDVINVEDIMERLKNEENQIALDVDLIRDLKFALALVCANVLLSYSDLEQFEDVMTSLREMVKDLFQSILVDVDNKYNMPHVLGSLMDNIDDCISSCPRSTSMTEEELDFLLLNLHHISKFLAEELFPLETQYEIFQNVCGNVRGFHGLIVNGCIEHESVEYVLPQFQLMAERVGLFLWECHTQSGLSELDEDDQTDKHSHVIKLEHLLLKIVPVELELMHICYTNLKSSTSAQVGCFIKPRLETFPHILREYLIYLQEHMVTVSISGARNIHVMMEFLLIILTDMPTNLIHHETFFDFLARVGALTREVSNLVWDLEEKSMKKESTNETNCTTLDLLKYIELLKEDLKHVYLKVPDSSQCCFPMSDGPLFMHRLQRHLNDLLPKWIDKDGKTPLIVACMKPNGLNVAKTFLELGANVNAYRPGYHAGTALHNAAKRGLDDTVQLLLSYGANPLIKNDACQTPLEVARAKGFSDVIRTIERQICIFSGWMREFYGPGFLEALTPQLLSRKIWVVVIPCGIADPMKPLKLQLAIYSSLQPRNVIALWRAIVEDIRQQRSDPVLTIFDKTSNTRYKFTSVSDSEQQQFLLLHRACIASIEVLPSRLPQNTQTAATQSETAAQAMELAIGINSSIDSAKENKILHHHGQSSGVKNEYDWCNNTDDSAHSGWGSLVRSEPRSEITNNDWTDDRTKVQENGWGNTADVSSQRPQQSLPKSTPSELSCSGWIDEPAVEEYNGWGVPKPRQGHRDASAEVHYQGWENTSKDKTASSDVSSWEAMDKTDNAPEFRPIVYPGENAETQEGNNPAFDFAVPSSPPVPEEVEDIHYPVIDLSPFPLSNPAVEQKTASVMTQKEKEHEPALCIICWEASVEGACVPCGHMVGCMQCLNQIKSKKGECPVCRVKIDQVIKLYSV